jgi:hypothetical protein
MSEQTGITVIYVTPGNGPRVSLLDWIIAFIHLLIGWPVRFITQGRYAHVALCGIFREDKGVEILEAIAPRVRYCAPDKYDLEPIRQVVFVPLTVEQLAAGIAAVQKEIDKWYGLDDCNVGLWHTVATLLFGEQIGNKVGRWAARVFDDNDTRDCSALETVFFQGALGINGFMPDHLPCMVTPEDSRPAVLMLPGAKIVAGDGMEAA